MMVAPRLFQDHCLPVRDMTYPGVTERDTHTTAGKDAEKGRLWGRHGVARN